MRNPKELSAEQLAVILDRADVVETWLKAVRDHAKALLEAGESIPGWTLKPTRPVRKWTDERAVRQRLSGEGLTGFLVEELATPAQVENAAEIGMDFRAPPNCPDAQRPIAAAGVTADQGHARIPR